MLILAIDPGNKRSAFVRYDLETQQILDSDLVDNDWLLNIVEQQATTHEIVIEWIESFGMAVGKEVFETCRWIGRFHEAGAFAREPHYLTRREIKHHLCHTARATDSNIRQALIDRFGAPGTKKEPGMTYGLKKDMWSALAVAVTYADLFQEVGE